MRLELLNTEFAIARLDSAASVPAWASGHVVSITRTPEELSIVCDASLVPLEVRAQRGWRCLKIEGPLDFSMVGALASIVEPLARSGVPIFVISTFDTDYILIGEANLDVAAEALKNAGHVVRRCS